MQDEQDGRRRKGSFRCEGTADVQDVQVFLRGGGCVVWSQLGWFCTDEDIIIS